MCTVTPVHYEPQAVRERAVTWEATWPADALSVSGDAVQYEQTMTWRVAHLRRHLAHVHLRRVRLQHLRVGADGKCSPPHVMPL